MDEKLVDPSRRHECSTGLHVARRDYVRHFHGDTITIIKIAPEDVIAVPFLERSKMRVCAYHLVVVLPKEGADLIRQNRPMTTHGPSAKMLADVIAGDHIGIIEHVIIGSAFGGDIKVVPVGPISTKATEFKPAMNNGEAKALDDGGVSTVSIKEVRDAVREAMETQEAAQEQQVAEANEILAQMPFKEVADDKLIYQNNTPLPAPMPVEESAKDRRNRVKREKRAAAKIQANVKQDTAPPTQPKKKKSNVAPARLEGQSAMIDNSVGKRHPKADQVIAMHKDGKSKRQIESALGLSRRSIVKIIGNG
jgi:hypothetical protein